MKGLNKIIKLIKWGWKFWSKRSKKLLIIYRIFRIRKNLGKSFRHFPYIEIRCDKKIEIIIVGVRANKLVNFY